MGNAAGAFTPEPSADYGRPRCSALLACASRERGLSLAQTCRQAGEASRCAFTGGADGMNSRFRKKRRGRKTAGCSMSEPIILIPLDGSERALAALPVAKVLGEIERATLRIFHVADHKPAADELLSRLRLESSGARRLHDRRPRWRTGRGNSAGRGGDQAAIDRHVHAHRAPSGERCWEARR